MRINHCYHLTLEELNAEKAIAVVSLRRFPPRIFSLRSPPGRGLRRRPRHGRPRGTRLGSGAQPSSFHSAHQDRPEPDRGRQAVGELRSGRAGLYRRGGPVTRLSAARRRSRQDGCRAARRRRRWPRWRRRRSSDIGLGAAGRRRLLHRAVRRGGSLAAACAGRRVGEQLRCQKLIERHQQRSLAAPAAASASNGIGAPGRMSRSGGEMPPKGLVGRRPRGKGPPGSVCAAAACPDGGAAGRRRPPPLLARRISGPLGRSRLSCLGRVAGAGPASALRACAAAVKGSGAGPAPRRKARLRAADAFNRFPGPSLFKAP